MEISLLKEPVERLKANKKKRSPLKGKRIAMTLKEIA